MPSQACDPSRVSQGRAVALHCSMGWRIVIGTIVFGETYTMQIRPRRSALYMPGSNARALEKAKTLDADVVIFDLEDAVAPEVKADARAQVADAVRLGGYGRREVVIRINAPDTEWSKADVDAMAAVRPDALLVPKVSTPDAVAAIERWLAEADPGIKLWAMIETPLAILNVNQIAAAAAAPGSRLACFVVGTNDLIKDTRAEMDAARTPALFWLSATVTAARAYGIDVLDGVYNNFKDLEGFERECAHGRMLGMDGKTVIHPTQIEAANRTFSPAAEDVEWARRVLNAFEQPENQGKGVIKMDGQMVELLHAEMAKRVVAIADAIAG